MSGATIQVKESYFPMTNLNDSNSTISLHENQTLSSTELTLSVLPIGRSMELFSSRRWRLDFSEQKAVVFMLPPPKKNMQHILGIIPELFDVLADPVVHLHLLKSSKVGPKKCDQIGVFL